MSNDERNCKWCLHEIWSGDVNIFGQLLKYFAQDRLDDMNESMRPDSTLLADSTGVTWSQSDKAFFSPWCTPWILNLPHSVYYADQQNSMVNIFPTIVEYSRWIMRPSSCVYGNWDWSSFQCIYDSSASWRFGNCVDFETTTLFLAGFVDSFVWICWLRFDSVVFDVF